MASVAFAASFLPPTNRPIAARNRHAISLSASASASSSSSSSSSSPSSSVWKQVIDPRSAQPYYWNTLTNKTSWEIPEGWATERHGRFDVEEEEKEDDGDDTTRIQESSKLSFEDLTSLLLKAIAVDSSRFGDLANQYRPQCFNIEYFDYLTNIIDSTQDNEKKEAFTQLRARLANPLLKNPPPY